MIPGAGFIRGLEPLPARGGPGAQARPCPWCWADPAVSPCMPMLPVPSNERPHTVPHQVVPRMEQQGELRSQSP